MDFLENIASYGFFMGLFLVILGAFSLIAAYNENVNTCLRSSSFLISIAIISFGIFLSLISSSATEYATTDFCDCGIAVIQDYKYCPQCGISWKKN